MRKFARDLLLILSTFCIASQATAGFFGNTVSANYEWPNLGTVLYASGNAIAGTGVEFPNVGGQNVSVDFSDTGFRITYTTGWFLNTTDPKTFDGWVISDVLGTIPNITGVSLAGTNIPGYDGSQVSFDAKHVYVNQLGFSGFNPGSYIDVNVSFAATAFLQFPLGVLCDGVPCTPYTAKVASVMDHSGTPLDPINNPGRWYVTDGKVKAFNGEIGEAIFGTNCSPGPGYQKNALGEEFLSELNYVGATCKKPEHPDANTHPERFLNYDGHPGYDYPYTRDTPVVAAASGRLFKAQTDTVNHTRNVNSKCFNSNAWTEWHAFYIDHDNGYTTWYLHVKGLAPEIEKAIRNDFSTFVDVQAGQIVAFVGNWAKCTSVGYHLHFEVRRGQVEIVDPYSAGLWIAE